VSEEARGRAFDALAREVASGTLSRGRMLKLMGAALVGGTLGSLGIGGVAAADDSGVDCKRNGKRCKKDHQCCSGICSTSAAGDTCASCRSPGGSCAAGELCCTGGICSDGTCCPTSCTTSDDCCPGMFCGLGQCLF